MKQKFYLHSLMAMIGILASSLFIFSCSDKEYPINEPSKSNEIEEGGSPKLYINLTEDQRKASNETRAFEFDFFKEICKSISDKEDQNVFVSPVSVAATLTMLANGSNEASQEEVIKILGCDIDALNSYYQLICRTLSKADNQVKYNFANSLWVSPSVQIENSYISLLKEIFAAEVFLRDLTKEESKDELNQWYYDHTDGMISDFLRNTILGSSSLYVGNALSFKGKWTAPFKEEDTYKEVFHSANNKDSMVEMMHAKEKTLTYGEPQEGGILISLPFGNSTFEIEFYLPEEGKDLKEIYPLLDSILSTSPDYRAQFNLTLPKFMIRNRYENCHELLRSLGIKSIFEAGSFDWKDDIKLNSLTHEAFIEIDESGAKAAAASGAVMASDGIISENNKVVDLKFDRPFFFSITCGGISLFLGMVNNL